MDFKSGNDTAMALDFDTQDTAPEPTTEEKAVAMDKTDKGSDELVQAAAGEALAGAVASACNRSAPSVIRPIAIRATALQWRAFGRLPLLSQARDSS